VSRLRLDGVRAAYGDREVLRGVDLEVAPGELMVVLGPSGSGKSTLLRVVAGLEPAVAGRVVIDDRDVTRLRPGRRRVAMVFQSYALFPHLSAADNITFGLRVRDVSRSEAASRAQEAARVAGCTHLLQSRPGELSGGERQRVALARALASQPTVLLLDEPLSNLDPELREQTRSELRALHERLGSTAVHVTHDQTEALLLADRVAVLRDGQFDQVGTPRELWDRPQTLFVARFIGSPAMNLLPVNHPLVPPGMASSGPAEMALGVRPHAIVLGHGGTVGRVVRVESVGADAHVHIRVGDGPTLVARVPTALSPVAGVEVSLAVKPEDWHRFDARTGRRLAR